MQNNQMPKARVSQVTVIDRKLTGMTPPEHKEKGKHRSKAVQWPEKEHKGFADKLTRNLAMASALLLCIVAVQAGSDPTTVSVFQSAQEHLSMDLDDTLGKLSFVSNLVPDSALVFWNAGATPQVSTPADGAIVHAWNQSEPYLTFQGANGNVTSAAAGEVMSVAHGEDEERIVRVRHENGLESLYGNLSACFVQEGDQVSEGDLIGQSQAESEVYFELRQDGRSIDPTYYLKDAGSDL